jgi:hypothetical protein
VRRHSNRLPAVTAWHEMICSACSVQRYPSDKEKKLLMPDEIFDVRESCKISEFFEKSPLSRAGKHPDFQVTSCHHFDTTNVDFAYIKSE